MSESDTRDHPESPESTPAVQPKRRRKMLLLGLAAFFALAGAAWGTYWWLAGRFIEQTDDAYVGGNIVQITPQISGTVLVVHADNTEFVRAGEPLVELDRADTRMALEQAEAQLAQAVRHVRTLFAQKAQLAADVAQREADLNLASADLERRRALRAAGTITKEDFEHVRTQARTAEAALNAAKQQLTAIEVQVDATTLATHPDVQRTAAQVREAYLAWRRTVLLAPVPGYVAMRNVQVGQRVEPGMPLMAVVPLEEVWVDANFKEPQLRDMRVGQPVTLTADAYGGAVVYHGKVEGLSPGTGSAFALLPPQNATGNWIKVVQRLPVRIALDPRELAEHPLRIGLSVEASVDIRDGAGPELPVAAHDSADRTQVFAAQLDGAGALVKRIIAANDGDARDAGAGVARQADAHADSMSGGGVPRQAGARAGDAHGIAGGGIARGSDAPLADVDSVARGRRTASQPTANAIAGRGP